MADQRSVKFKISDIDVISIAEPDESDLRIITHKAKAKNKSVENKVYLVKIYMNTEMLGFSRSYHLYIGDYRINHYVGFQGGICFKMYDKEELLEFSEKPIRFTEDLRTFIDTGFIFPKIIIRRK